MYGLACQSTNVSSQNFKPYTLFLSAILSYKFSFQTMLRQHLRASASQETPQLFSHNAKVTESASIVRNSTTVQSLTMLR